MLTSSGSSIYFWMRCNPALRAVNSEAVGPWGPPPHVCYSMYQTLVVIRSTHLKRRTLPNDRFVFLDDSTGLLTLLHGDLSWGDGKIYSFITVPCARWSGNIKRCLVFETATATAIYLDQATVEGPHERRPLIFISILGDNQWRPIPHEPLLRTFSDMMNLYKQSCSTVKEEARTMAVEGQFWVIPFVNSCMLLKNCADRRRSIAMSSARADNRSRGTL